MLKEVKEVKYYSKSNRNGTIKITNNTLLLILTMQEKLSMIFTTGILQNRMQQLLKWPAIAIEKHKLGPK